MSSVLSVVDSENYRNQRLNGRKSKLDEAKNNLPKPSKRAALGTITNVAATRVQPFRAAKAAGNEVKKKTGQSDVENDENAFSKHIGSSYIPPVIQSQQHKPFTIHVDPEPQQQPTDVKQPTLNEAVTCLSRQPLACISKEESRIESEGTESPMVIGSPDDDLVVISSDEIDNKEEITDIDTLTDLIYGVPEYAKDIHKYLKQAEGKNRPKPGYMKKQPDINISMRSILVDWLVEVAEEYKLMPQTLYLTVNYIDRFLSCMSVLRGKLQLVGTACMLVASKFEEIYPPEVSEFVYITDDTYTNKQGRLGILNETAHNQSVITREGSGCDKGRNIINRGLIEVPRALTVLRMEHLILKTLNFDLSVPTALNFLERYVLAAGASNGGSQLESLAKYLCELTLIDYEPFIKYLPSTVAASAVCIACHTLGMEPWTPTLSHHSGYYLSDIQSCVIDIHRTFRNASQHPQQAIREKFTSMRYHQVAQLPPRPQPPV